MEKRDERFYDITRLNRWFAFSSFLLLATVTWMTWGDYDRPWKAFQRQFFRLDADRSRAAIEAEKEKLAQEGMLQKLEAKLVQVEKELSSSHAVELAEALANLRVLEARLYRVDQDYSFAKAILDTRRYEFESTRAGRGADHVETTRASETYREADQIAEQRRQAYEKVLAERNTAEARVDQIVGRQKELQKQRKQFMTGIDLHRRRLQTLQPSLASTVRNMPILDFANPSVKVQQILLPHFERDYHFADVLRVDRCTTCHTAINREGFEDTPQPFTTHPQLELYLSSTSPHPVESYGCTICHGGKGRATDFVDAAHTPSDEQEESRWEKEFGWDKLEHWEHPMRPTRLVQSSCRKCHTANDIIPQAELYNEGKLLYEKLGCFNCHKTEDFTDEFRKVGPNLVHVVDKVTPQWAFHWIKNPPAIHPTTRMPRFFGLSNNSDPHSLTRSDVEIRSLVAYVFGHSSRQGLEEIPVPSSAKAGERLFRTVGCVACHIVDDSEDPGSQERDAGPNLSTVGSKANERWLYNWVRNPQKHFPGARMPNFRLTEQEAADLAAFLMTRIGEESNGGWSFPPLDEQFLESMVTEKLMERSTQGEARERAKSMNTSEQLSFLGERLMSRYGCFGCHDITGQETSVPIGREFIGQEFSGQEAVGDKSLERVVFGFVDIPHTWHDWIDKKLESPRIFDQGYERKPSDKLRMPKYNLTPHQREALACFLLSLTNEKIPPGFQRRFPESQLALQRGEALVREFNCRACHRFATDRLVFANPQRSKDQPKEIAVRGVVTTVVEDESLFFWALQDQQVGDLEFTAGEISELELDTWLRWERPIGGYAQDEFLWLYAVEEGFDYERTEVDEGDEDALAEWSAFRDSHLHMLPPLLEGQGARTQPDWLFHFLKNPFEMRLQLDVRMPNFSLSDAQARGLVEYFAALDEASFPYLFITERTETYRQTHGEEILLAREMFDSKDIQCISCHIRGGILPEGDKSNWGPDLARTPQRLRPEWIVRWLEDPQLLQPGTKMPTFDSFNDAHREAMKDFLLNFDYFYPKTESPDTSEQGKPESLEN